MNYLPAIVRLAQNSSVDPVSDCWLYQRKPFGKSGHCRISDNGKEELIHRFSYRTFVGDIPDGLMVLHRCVAHPNCWNPKHLYVGTQLDNSRDMKEQGRQQDQWGDKNRRSVLTKEEVIEIKKASSSIPSRVLAESFGVSLGCVSHIRTGYTWSHVRI